MSNNNSARNVYNKHVSGANDSEMELLLNASSESQPMVGNSQVTTINIESDMTPGTSQQNLQRLQNFQQRRLETEATRINMETNVINEQISNSNVDSSANSQTRSWRENLYEVFSSSVSPRTRTHVLRAFFTPTSPYVRLQSTHTNVLLTGDQLHFTLNHQNNQREGESQSSSRSQRLPSSGLESPPCSALRLSRQNSRLTNERSLSEISTPEFQTPAADTAIGNSATVAGNNTSQSVATNFATNGGHQFQRQNLASGSTDPAVDTEEERDAMWENLLLFAVKVFTYFIRYLPFIFIVFVKFIHDNLLGILDILVLHGVVHHINKSIKEQVAKLNQKSFVTLLRDLILVACVVSYRFLLSNSMPDPFGLLINPPEATITLDVASTQKTEPTKVVSLDTRLNSFTNEGAANALNSTISVSKSITFGTLIYYVAVNDLILKLLTQIVKIIVTMVPNKAMRRKSRARLYALIETFSQFYRALAPMRLWLRFLYESYLGLEVISGILFSLFYVGAKLFELFERGDSLKKAVINFMRNMDYDRKPTKDELEAAGTVCPICHDSFSSPLMLECGHIFCDECVNTWFKREHTCPMCRAKISEDPTWQDGATTYFYELC